MRRNPIIPRLILAFPCMMMILMPWAANLEIKYNNLAVVDLDYSALSRRLVEKVASTDYFNLVENAPDYGRALESVERGEADVILEIPRDFAKSLGTGCPVELQISANSINGTKGGLGSSYLSTVVNDFVNQELGGTGMARLSVLNLYNPHLNYKVLGMIKEANPDFVVTGPAFNAGRYGVAAGTMAKAVKDELNIPVLTGMYPENPGADMYKKDVYIVETKNSAAGMRDAMKKIGKLGPKVAKGEEIGAPKEEGYIERGVRVNFFSDKIGSQRAVEMLIKKINGEEFETEYPMPAFDRVEPGKAIKDLSKARIALVTSGGTVPKGNPDHIESSSATKYGSYDFSGINDLTDENSETAHGGYDPVYANEDGDRVLPIDVMRELEKEGVIGSLHETWYSTVGNGTAVANADAFGTEIGEKLLADNVDAVVLTST